MPAWKAYCTVNLDDCRQCSLSNYGRDCMNIKIEDEPQNLMKLVDLIHGETCGCDDKRCQWPTEIYDWLANGDARELTEQDVPDLVREWQEYQGRE